MLTNRFLLLHLMQTSENNCYLWKNTLLLSKPFELQITNVHEHYTGIPNIQRQSYKISIFAMLHGQYCDCIQHVQRALWTFASPRHKIHSMSVTLHPLGHNIDSRVDSVTSLGYY